MNFELIGKLVEKYNEVQVSDKFKKREFVLETTDNKFTESIKFQLVQNSTDLIDPFNVGQDVKVSFNIKGNKWKDNYFVNLQAWRIEQTGSSEVSSNEMDTPPPPAIDDFDEEEDSLPF